MTVLPIVQGADTPVLRAKAKKVPKVTKDISKLIKNMLETVKKARGAGLAAPQIGESLRVCVAVFNGKMTPMVNPEITWKSEETDKMEEACLSLENISVVVTRPTEVIVKYLDEKEAKQERHLKGFDARVVQHELDHLDGVLIVDYK